MTLLNTAQLYHTSENCIGNGRDGWNRSEETETVEELAFRCICGFKQKARRPFILSQVLFQQRVRPILTNKQGLLLLTQKKQLGTDPKSQPPPDPLFFFFPGKLRSEVPGGEKALVISKFDALSQRTDQLIPTLRLGSV